jgi:hypothetical protein
MDSLRPTPTPKIIRIMIKLRVMLEPELQQEVGTMRPEARRVMARKLYRWAKQLWISADILEAHENACPVKRLKRIKKDRLIWN